MLKEIKIIDETGNKIEPVNNQVVLPFGDEKKFISVETAENIIRVLRGQINIINVNKTSGGEHTTHIDRKTGGAT